VLDILKIFFKARGTRPVIVMVCLLLGGLAEGFGMASMLPVFSVAFDGGTGDPKVALFADALAVVGLPATLPVLVALSVGGIVVKNLLNLAAMTYVGYAVAHVSTSMRRDLLGNLLNVRWGYFTERPLGRITNTLSVDATRAGEAYLRAANFIVNAIQTVIYTLVALFVSWKVALAAILIGGLIVLFLSFLVSAAKKAGRKQTDRTADFITYLSDALNNIRPLKAMARQGSFANLLERNIGGLRAALRRQVISKQALKNIDEILGALSLGVGLVVAISYWNLPPAELAVIGILLVQLVNSIGKIQKEYQDAAIYESAYHAVLNQINETRAAREPDQGAAAPSLNREIRLVDVCFSHPGTPVLQDVSIDFPRDSVTVLTGPSGSGKTTITDLLIGFRAPDSGAVLIDGRPLGEFDLNAWRGMIGYVPQELVLFHDSIFANIALGDPEIGEAEVRAALDAAGALDFVDAMERGVHTEVGEKGAKLSGGQRQRIALARALVKRPALLILDEVTSALDPSSERAIVENIRALRGQSTIIAITHRAAFLDIADRVYELADGRLLVTDRHRTRLGRAEG
jgi:ATP-binding cassette subfamily C protein